MEELEPLVIKPTVYSLVLFNLGNTARQAALAFGQMGKTEAWRVEAPARGHSLVRGQHSTTLFLTPAASRGLSFPL